MNALNVMVTAGWVTDGRWLETRSRTQFTHAERNIFTFIFDRLFTWSGPGGTKDSSAISWTDFHGPLTLVIT